MVKTIRSPPTKKGTKKEFVNVELFWQHYEKGKKKYQVFVWIVVVVREGNRQTETPDQKKY